MVRLPSRKRLAALLSTYPGFSKPKKKLEQYTTDPDIAATLALYAAVRQCPMRVADLGCGTGLLLYALGCTGCLTYGVCLEIDRDAVFAALRAFRERRLGHLVDIVQCDARKTPVRTRGVDLAVLNPPFGIRSKRGLDLEFLREALRIARRSLSIHAWSEGLLQAIERKVGCKPALIAQGYQRIPQMFEEHRRRLHRTLVAVVECEASEG